MKTKSLLMFALVTMLSLGAQAQKLKDVRRIADEFSKMDIVQYEGQFGFVRLLPDGTRLYTQGDFTRNLDGTIPRLVIDGEQIISWGEEPEKGLKLTGPGSIKDFWVQLNGWDGRSAKYTTYGFTSDDLLLPKEALNVVIKLSNRQTFVAFDASGVDAANLALDIGMSRFYYNAATQGFDIWYDPATAGDYSIVNTSTGFVISSGSIEDGLSEANIFNLSLEGGVRELFSVGRDDASWMNQWPMALESDGQWMPTQVYLARTYGGELDLSLNGLPGGKIKVYSNDSGERVLVSETEIPTTATDSDPGGVGKGGGGNLTRLTIPSGYDRLVVEVLGDPGANWTTFSLWAYRGPGGKG